jgi:hypothetical protein
MAAIGDAPRAERIDRFPPTESQSSRYGYPKPYAQLGIDPTLGIDAMLRERIGSSSLQSIATVR